MDTNTSQGEEASSRQVQAMEVSAKAENDLGISQSVLQLQKKLDLLKIQLMKAKAQLNVSHRETMEDDLDGSDEQAKKFHALIKKRAESFLNLQGWKTAVEAAELNKALTKAFCLEKEGDIQLEKEEEDYVKGLLEEQKEMSGVLSKCIEEESEAELKVMSAKANLAQLYFKYRSLCEIVMGSRKTSQKNWDEETKKVQETLVKNDHKLNQLRFTIQKFMMSHAKLGLQFDDALNAEFEEVLLKCGMTPKDMRDELHSAEMTPAAAGDFPME